MKKVTQKVQPIQVERHCPKSNYKWLSNCLIVVFASSILLIVFEEFLNPALVDAFYVLIGFGTYIFGIWAIVVLRK